MAATSPLSARFAGPELLQRGAAQGISCPLYRDGALVAPSSGTISIYRADGTQVVAAAAVTVAASIATYTTGTFAGETLGEGWRVEWLLTVSGAVHTFDRQAALCRRRLFPVVTDADLIRRHSDLVAIRPPDMTSFQDYLDESWVELLHQIRQKGSIPHLVASPEDLRQVHLFLALKLVFTDFSVRFGDGSRWPTLADSYSKESQAAFKQLSLSYSSDDSGNADATRRAVQSVTFLACGGEGWDY